MKKLILSFFVMAMSLNAFAQLADPNVLYLRGDFNGWGTTDPLNYTPNGSNYNFWIVKSLTASMTNGYKIANSTWSWQYANNAAFTLPAGFTSLLCRWQYTNLAIGTGTLAVATPIQVKNGLFYVKVGSNRYPMTAGSNFTYTLSALYVPNASTWSIVYDDNTGTEKVAYSGGSFTNAGSNVTASFSFDFGSVTVSGAKTSEVVTASYEYQIKVGSDVVLTGMTGNQSASYIVPCSAPQYTIERRAAGSSDVYTVVNTVDLTPEQRGCEVTFAFNFATQNATLTSNYSKVLEFNGQVLSTADNWMPINSDPYPYTLVTTTNGCSETVATDFGQITGYAGNQANIHADASGNLVVFTPVFRVDYNDGTGTWPSVIFTQDATDPTKFTAILHLTSTLGTQQCWVGYNNGVGTGIPGWGSAGAGQSATVNINAIPGLGSVTGDAAGTNIKLTVYTTGTGNNWGVTGELSTEPAITGGWFDDYFTLNGTIYAIGGNQIANPTATNFQGANLGVVTALTLSSMNMSAWNSVGDISQMWFNCLIYDTNTNTEVAVIPGIQLAQQPFDAANPNNFVGAWTGSQDLLSGITPFLNTTDTYQLRVWIWRNGSDAPASDPGNVYLNYYGSNFAATFTLGNLATAIPAVPANSSSVTVQGNNVVANFEGAATVQIVSVTGQLVVNTTAANGFVKALPAGMYVVKVNGKATKVMIP